MFPAGAAEKVASTVVEDFHGLLLSVMKDSKTLGVKARYARLEPRADLLFDMPRMTRIATGDFWAKASPQQRKRLVKAFKHMGVSRLVTLFDGYSGETFETDAERPGPQSTRLVQTRLVAPGKDPVLITYVLVESDGRWAIIDAILDNKISELTVRRSEYRRVLETQGVAGLIKVLDRKAEELLSE